MADGEGQSRRAVRSNAAVRRYAAFISYSHAEDEFANWLHKRLESYPIPRSLVGRPGPARPIGKRLGRVFRDRVELSAAHDLGAEIRSGLEASDALIVLCSPNAARSKYVEEEIRYFKELGKGQSIYAAILAGEPHAASKPGRTAEDECFPRALVYRLNPDLTLSSQPETSEPIAADFRDMKDGRENGSLKIIAGLLGVGLDDLVQREKQAERGRRRRTQIIAATMSVLALGAAVAGGFAWLKQNEAEARRVEADQQRNIAKVNETRATQNAALAITNEQKANENAILAEQKRAEAERNANERDIQRLAAEANAAEASAQRDSARNSLARIFAERSWQAMERNEYPLAARYALAGWRVAPANSHEYRAALSRVLHDSGDARLLLGHEGWVMSAAFSPDSTRILSATQQGTVRIWDVTSGRELVAMRGCGGSTMTSASFSPDGSRVLTTCDDATARVLDAASGQEAMVLKGHRHVVVGAEFSQSGTKILTWASPQLGRALENTVRVWETASGRKIAVLRHEQEVNSAAFSADGERILTVSGSTTTPYTVRVWDAASGMQTLVLRGEDGKEFTEGYFAYFSPDGSRILTVALRNRPARLWDASTGRELAVLRGHEATVWSGAFSPDGARIVTASEDRTARIWDATTGRELAVLRGHVGPLYSASFSRDGARVVTTSPVTLSSTGDRTMRVWDAAPATPNDQRELAVMRGHTGNIRMTAFSPDGQRIITVGGDTGSTPTSPGDGDARVVRVWNSFGRRAAALDTGQLAARNAEHRYGGGKEYGSHDATRAIRVDQGQARIWDKTSNREIAWLRQNRWVVDAQFSPDGATIVTASEDYRIRLWDTASAREIISIPGLSAPFWKASFTADGQRIILTRTNDETRGAIIYDVSRITQPIADLARAACSNFLLSSGRKFSTTEIGADPLIRELWLLDGRNDRDVCEGVPGAPSIARPQASAQTP